MNPASSHAVCLRAPARPTRVAALLAVIVGLSLLDLVLTVGHMASSGMFESNPIAAALANWTGTPLAIVDFKVLSVLVGVSLLFRMRRHASAELAAWLMTVVLVVLSVRWGLYASELADMDQTMLLAVAESDAEWVRFN
jgi:uncharacterized membrane protein